VDELKGEDLGTVDDGSLEADFGELQRASEALEVEKLRRLAEIRRRRTYERDGFVSASAWLVDRHRMAGGTAARAGSCSRRPGPSRSGTFYRMVGYWRQQADGRHPERRFERRGLHVSPTVFGMVRVDGDLDPENGQALITAIRAVVDAETRSGDESDTRTPSQRRADALGEICRRHLACADRPLVGGERPQVSVLVDLEALQGGAGRAELEEAGPIDAESARRIACDAAVARVITKAPSEPIDVGRRSPVVSPALRRALVVRDRGCTFPGCDRPPGWCDGHHVKHWADGGETSLANTTLLCRRHHRLVHPPNGFRLVMADGRPVFRRPDGSMLEERGPPGLTGVS